MCSSNRCVLKCKGLISYDPADMSSLCRHMLQEGGVAGLDKELRWTACEEGSIAWPLVPMLLVFPGHHLGAFIPVSTFN